MLLNFWTPFKDVQSLLGEAQNYYTKSEVNKMVADAEILKNNQETFNSNANQELHSMSNNLAKINAQIEKNIPILEEIKKELDQGSAISPRIPGIPAIFGIGIGNWFWKSGMEIWFWKFGIGIRIWDLG